MGRSFPKPSTSAFGGTEEVPEGDGHCPLLENFVFTAAINHVQGIDVSVIRNKEAQSNSEPSLDYKYIYQQQRSERKAHYQIIPTLQILAAQSAQLLVQYLHPHHSPVSIIPKPICQVLRKISGNLKPLHRINNPRTFSTEFLV